MAAKRGEQTNRLMLRLVKSLAEKGGTSATISRQIMEAAVAKMRTE
jgi:hypothetical protein